MVIVIPLAFGLLGLGVFAVAMYRTRPAGSRAGTSKLGRTAVIGGVVLLFAFGITVPALVLAFNGEHKASVAVGGVRLTKSEQRGRELFARACSVCHTLAAARAVGRVGPNLDVRVGEDISTEAGRRALVENAISEGRARGLGQMPAQLYQGREAQEVAEFVTAAAGRR
jgi:cytochrome c551